MINGKEVIIRLILSAIIGGIIGIEREANNRPAGLRTHVLVTVGATLIMLVSIDGFSHVPGLVQGDPGRIAAQVVSGIGFLGAGTIMKTGNQIKGLTTAASLWICAGIGLALGSGYYLGAFVTTAIVLITLMSLGIFEKQLFSGKYKCLEIKGKNKMGLIGEIGTVLGNNDIIIKDITILNSEEELLSDDEDISDIIEIRIMIKLPSHFSESRFFYEMKRVKGLKEIRLDRRDIA